MAVKVKVIQVSVPDAIGVGAKVLRQIADAKINLLAFCAYTLKEEATLTFVVEPGKDALARKILKKAGYISTTTNAVCAVIGNKPDALATIAEHLAAVGINIMDCYTTTSGNKAAVILVVSNIPKTLKTLAHT